jgi:hypothetical protein
MSLDNIPHRQVLFLNLLESEREYVRRMNILYIIFFERIMTESESLNLHYAVTMVFPPYMFSLLIFCRSFYLDLKERLCEPLRGMVERKYYTHGRTIPDDGIVIADIFMKQLKNLEQFYVEYPSAYDSCRTSISELCANNPEFFEFLKVRRDLPCCEGMTLENFLILPFQRLSFYCEIIQGLSKHTEENHQDAKPLRTLTKKMRDLLSKQGRDIAKVDNWHQVVNQSKKLGLPQLLSSTNRSFIREVSLVFIRC